MKKEEKLTLTVREAATISNIGINRIYELTNDPDCDFVIFVGRKRLIKVDKFKKFIEGASVI